MKLSVLISTDEAETVYNALRLANFAVEAGDEARVFLLGRGVELDRIEDERFKVREQARRFLSLGGQIMACGACLKLRESASSELCPSSTMKDLYLLVRDADRVVSF
jgi:uncharacterized protein involved in oxidation of intracellular sulfur